MHVHDIFSRGGDSASAIYSEVSLHFATYDVCTRSLPPSQASIRTAIAPRLYPHIICMQHFRTGAILCRPGAL